MESNMKVGKYSVNGLHTPNHAELNKKAIAHISTLIVHGQRAPTELLTPYFTALQAQVWNTEV